MGWVLKFPCRLPSVVDELKILLKIMREDLSEWQKMVADMRQCYYSLNYFTTEQLLLLRKELCHFTDSSYDGAMQPDVIALLQCLSREVTPGVVTSIFRGESNDDEEDRTLEKETMDVSHLDVSIQEKDIEGPSKITKHFLTSNSMFSPQPQLAEVHLTNKQKAIMTNLQDRYFFSDKLIHLAFEQCEQPEIEEDVERWCSEHQHEYGYLDDEEESEESEEAITDEEDLSLEENEHLVLEGEFLSMDKQTQSTPVITKRFTSSIKFKDMIPINEDHPVVKQLILAGYSLKLIQDATERYPNDAQKAMEYIDYLEDNDEDETEGIFPKNQNLLQGESYDQQQSDSFTGYDYAHNNMYSYYYCIYSVTDIDVMHDPSAESYLSVKDLGRLLKKLEAKCASELLLVYSSIHMIVIGPVNYTREIAKVLKKGEPNLIVVDSG